MSSQFSANSSNRVSLSIEASAAALWTFIKARSPRFTFESAVDLFQELNPNLHPGTRSPAHFEYGPTASRLADKFLSVS